MRMPDTNIKTAWTGLLDHIGEDLDGSVDPKATARMCFYAGAFCAVHLMICHPFKMLSVWRELSQFKQELDAISAANKSLREKTK